MTDQPSFAEILEARDRVASALAILDVNGHHSDCPIERTALVVLNWIVGSPSGLPFVEYLERLSRLQPQTKRMVPHG